MPVAPTRILVAAPVGVDGVGVGELAETLVPLRAFATFWKSFKLRPESSTELMALQTMLRHEHAKE